MQRLRRRAGSGAQQDGRGCVVWLPCCGPQCLSCRIPKRSAVRLSRFTRQAARKWCPGHRSPSSACLKWLVALHGMCWPAEMLPPESNPERRQVKVNSRHRLHHAAELPNLGRAGNAVFCAYVSPAGELTESGLRTQFCRCINPQAASFGLLSAAQPTPRWQMR